MKHVLSNLPTEYDLRLALSEKRIRDKDKQSTVEVIRADLSLRFERLIMKSKKKSRMKN
jgi:hypothetical protein